jgi:hypothetical protein
MNNIHYVEISFRDTYTTGIRNRMLLTLIIGKAISLQSNRREEPSRIDGEAIG